MSTAGSKHPGHAPTARPKKPARRRRSAVLPTVRPDGQEGLPPLGFPIDAALRCAPADIKQSTRELSTIGDAMDLPDAPDRAGPLLPGQKDLSWSLADALQDHEPIMQHSGVTPAALFLGLDKLDVIARGKRITGVGQNLAANGRLFTGARFSFYFKRVMDLYKRWLDGPPEQRLKAVMIFGAVDLVRFRLLKQVQQAREQTGQVKQTLATGIEEQKDENAFHRALAQMDSNTMPDADTLLRATRHADRLQEQFGLGLDPAGATPAADRRSDQRSGPR